MSEPRKHSNNKTVGKHRKRTTVGRHVPNHALRDALPDELQQRAVDAPQEVPPHRRHGAAEDPARLHRHRRQQPAARGVHRQPECQLRSVVVCALWYCNIHFGYYTLYVYVLVGMFHLL